MAVSTLLHFLAAAHFWYGCWYDWNYVKIPKEIADLGDDILNTKKLKFLTYWDALLQSVFFTICLLNDVIGTNERLPSKPPFIRKLKDIILPTLAFPLSMFVGVTFWALYIIDRELILPKTIDQFFPAWLNHLMHTNVMLCTLLELLCCYRRYPPRKVGLTILLTFMFSYLAWIHYIHSYTNKWVYPILNILNFPSRIAFFVMNCVVVVVLYIVGERINFLFWEADKSGAKEKTLKEL